MKNTIIEKLYEIEKDENVRILYAIESGSRAWGFPSHDSDYDVRFIYIHEDEWYLSIDDKRDVIERPINDLLDVSGWDIRKMLKLLKRSNPSILEWLNSSIQYKVENEFFIELKEISKEYFCPKACMHHYLNMANNNFKRHIITDEIKLKKYFYVLRPIFSCMWIEKYGTAPAIEFEELMDNVLTDKVLIAEIELLLDKKRNSMEYHNADDNHTLIAFFEEQLEYYSEYVKTLEPKDVGDSERLDAFFRKVLAG